MRLPSNIKGGVIQTGVQSLGRHDINAPQRVAAAEATATKAWGQALKTSTDTFATIFNGQEAAKGKLALARRQSNDTLANTATQTYLESNASINLDGENVPPAVLDYAKSESLTGVVKSSDIMTGVMQRQHKLTKEATYAELGEFRQGNALQAAYISHMTGQWAGAAEASIQAKAQHNQDEIIADTDLEVLNATRALDVLTAKQIIEAGYHAGVYTKQVALEKTLSVEGDVAFLMATREIGTAQNSGDLALIKEELLTADLPLDREQRLKLLSEIDSQQSALNSQLALVQSDGLSQGLDMALSGNLNSTWIRSMLAAGELDNTGANQLRGIVMARKNAPIVSNKVERGFLKRDIIAIRYTQGGATTVSRNAQAMRERLYQAAFGADRYGNIIGDGTPSILGEDYDVLMAEVNTQEKATLENTQYRHAVKTIAGYSGVSEIGVGVEGNLVNKKAYAEGVKLLNGHMDAMGADADPLKFVEQFRDTFNPAVYEEEGAKLFMMKYPAYAAPDETGVLNRDSILLQIAEDLQGGRIGAFMAAKLEDELYDVDYDLDETTNLALENAQAGGIQ